MTGKPEMSYERAGTNRVVAAARDARKLKVFGVILFLFAAVGYALIRERGRAEGPVPRATSHAPDGEALPRAFGPDRRVEGIADEDAATDPVASVEPTPGQVLADVMSIDSALEDDLSHWEAVDWLAFAMIEGRPTFRVSREDVPELLAGFEQLRSSRVRQFLLVTFGALEAAEATEVAIEELPRPEMTASAAYVLGRSRDSRGLEALRAALSGAGPDQQRREALTFGLAQHGASVIPQLVIATEVWLLQGATTADPLPLGFARSADMRAPLRAIALEHAQPEVRAAAILGFVETARSERVDAGWLVALAAGPAEAVSVRVEALRGLSTLQPRLAAEVLTDLLEEPDPAPELLLAALEATRGAGIPEVHVDLLFELALAPSEGSLGAQALRALAASSDVAVQRRLAELLPRQDADEQLRLLQELSMRNHLPHGVRDGNALAPELVNAVRELLEDPELSPYSEHQALQVLYSHDPSAEDVRDRAWSFLLASPEEERSRRLMMVSHILGETVNRELVHSFRESDAFLPRLEAVATLSNVPGNLERAEVVSFLREEALPFLRASLPENTGASLISLGGRRPPNYNLGRVATGVFGRYGEPADIALLESLGSSFERNQSAWPEPLRKAVLAGLSESSAQASDLIRLRLLGRE